MTYGVTATGFVDKPIEAILDEIETAEKLALGAEFDVSAQSPAGQINGIMATQLRELWEVAQAVYSAVDPDTATGAALTALAAISGTVREDATRSTVTATVNLDAGKTLAAGAIASVTGNPDAKFRTTAAATNGGGAPANVSVAMEAVDTGLVIANAGTLTVIESAQSGWNTVTNALDATVGTEEETDAELRIRREEDLRRAGAAAEDAIEADVRAVDAVISCTVFNNETDETVDGIPPHSFEAVVLDGAAADIAQAIWDSKAAGIRDYGGTSGTAVDSDGANQTVYFTRPTEIRIYIDVFVTVDADYPVDGDTQIKTAIALWSQENLEVGEDFVLSQLVPVIFEIAGVVDVTNIEAGIAPAPGGTANIAIGARELATIDTADITVTS